VIQYRIADAMQVMTFPNASLFSKNFRLMSINANVRQVPRFVVGDRIGFAHVITETN
jgi:hypothetical protein